jgi:hypothetical protein
MTGDPEPDGEQTAQEKKGLDGDEQRPGDESKDRSAGFGDWIWRVHDFDGTGISSFARSVLRGRSLGRHVRVPETSFELGSISTMQWLASQKYNKPRSPLETQCLGRHYL